MKILLKLIVTTSICFVFLGCPGKDDGDLVPNITVKIKNNSNLSIIPYEQYGNNILQESSPFGSNEISLNEIEPSLSRDFSFVEGLIKKNGITIFIISKSDLQTIPWEEIREQNLVLKTFDLTLEELEAMEYTLAYP